MKTQNLGQLSASLSKIATKQGHYGYVTARRLVQSYGFRTVAQAINVIEARTTPRVTARLDLDRLIIH